VFEKTIYTPGEKPKVVIIPQGAGASQIAELLKIEGLIDNTLKFKIVSVLTKSASNLRAGRHILTKPLTLYDLVKKISETGGSFDIKVTIPEGRTIYDIARILENTMGFDTTEFFSIVMDKAFIDSLGLDVPTMEGFLFPETYMIPETYTVKQIVLELHKRFNKVVSEKKEELARYDRPLKDVITLASIIESEAKVPTERRIISSVYNNRLRIGMILQADPTTIYGLRLFHRPLLLSDLRDSSSLYNTYVYKGLPPGPICNPGSEAISAAMNPEETPYFYFVARDNGTHVFSRTLTEHHQAIREIRANRAK
jgi:UPF0755 protein